jgi:hypothetical protein
MSELYVSPSGNDNNSGELARPLRTVAAALKRGRGRDIMSSLRIRLRDGVYRSGELPLFPSDSGVTIEATGAPGAAIINGSQVLTGWQVFSGDVYRAPYSGAACPIATLFEDGVRARAARFPKYIFDADYPCAFAPYLFATGVNGSYTQIEFGESELDMSMWVMQQTRAFIWPGGGIGFNWFTDHVPLVAVNIPLNLIGLSQQTRYIIYSSIGSRYFIENVLDYLTEPGEFVWDGTHVYYRFRGDPLTAVIEMPVAYDLITLNGQPGDLVQDVSIDGLALTGTAIPPWYRHAHVTDGDGYTDRARGPLDFLATSAPYDRQMTLPQNRHGLIRMTNAANVHIDSCHLYGSGLHAVYAGGINTNHTIENSWLESAGHSGLYVDGLYPGGGDVSRDWTVTDVKVNDVGQLVGNGEGMIFINSGHHSVSHIEATNGPRNGFFIGAYTDIPSGSCYSEGIVLELSSFTDFCQDSGDVGVIGIGGISSISGGPTLTNTVRQVRVTGAHADPSMHDTGPNGIFTDNQSWTQVFENVEVSDTQGAQFRINDSGGHTYTNTSFLSDGSSNPAFNPALMSPDIGLTAAFPY